MTTDGFPRFSSRSCRDIAMSTPKMPRKDAADECPIASELARHFRANNKRGIVSCLAQLKSDPKRCKEFAKRSSDLDILVQLLRCKNDAIVNMSLSILADACMTLDVREKVLLFLISWLVMYSIEHSCKMLRRSGA